MRPFTAGSRELKRLCIHTITTKPLPIETAIEEYQRAGVGGISIWREAMAGRDANEIQQRLKDSDIDLVSYVRGGFFPAFDARRRQQAIDENLKVIDEAHELGAPLIVLVCGSDPKQSLAESCQQIQDGIAQVADHAASAGVRLGIEPLHPMYADIRSAINSLRQANDVAEALNLKNVGVTVDVYHLWWEPELLEQIDRCAALDKLYSYHVCDWKNPTTDFLNDRGLMGEGVINVPEISHRVESAGFDGFIEVEIFSNRYWAMEQREYLQLITHAFQNAT